MTAWRAGKGSPVIVSSPGLGIAINPPGLLRVYHVDGDLFTMSDYHQESGRAGRQGQAGRATTIITNKEEEQGSRATSTSVFFPDESVRATALPLLLTAFQRTIFERILWRDKGCCQHWQTLSIASIRAGSTAWILRLPQAINQQ